MHSNVLNSLEAALDSLNLELVLCGGPLVKQLLLLEVRIKCGLVDEKQAKDLRLVKAEKASSSQTATYTSK